MPEPLGPLGRGCKHRRALRHLVGPNLRREFSPDMAFAAQGGDQAVLSEIVVVTLKTCL
jgi:hypothetical protein